MKSLRNLVKSVFTVSILSIAFSSCSTPESEITPVNSAAKIQTATSKTYTATDSLRAFATVREIIANGNGDYTMYVGKPGPTSRTFRFSQIQTNNGNETIYNFYENANDTIYQYKFDRIANTRTFRKAHVSQDINNVLFQPEAAHMQSAVIHSHNNMPSGTVTALVANSLNSDGDTVKTGPVVRGGEGLGGYFNITSTDEKSAYKQVLDFAFSLCGPNNYPVILEYYDIPGTGNHSVLIKILCRSYSK